MTDCVAWIVKFRGGHQAAVAELELVHVLADEPELFPVLKSPPHCRHVFLWDTHVLPVFDLSAWLEQDAEPEKSGNFGVFRYRTSSDAPLEYGSLIMEGAPRRALVNDDHACELPPAASIWRNVAISCFDDEGRATPILDLPRIFSSVPPGRTMPE